MTQDDQLQKIESQIEFINGCLDWVQRKLHKDSQYDSGQLTVSVEKERACRERIVSLEGRLKALQMERETLLKQKPVEQTGALKIESGVEN